MPSLTVKNVPEDLYKRLKASAKRNRRSINSESLVRLELALRAEPADPVEFLARLHAFQKKLRLPPLTEAFLRKAISEGRP